MPRFTSSGGNAVYIASVCDVIGRDRGNTRRIAKRVGIGARTIRLIAEDLNQREVGDFDVSAHAVRELQRAVGGRAGWPRLRPSVKQMAPKHSIPTIGQNVLKAYNHTQIDVT
jgi:hypothetical protein